MKLSKHSIVLLIPYFGSWPSWFAFFLESCRHNEDINWIFYTDCPIPENAPLNIKFTRMSFAEYKKQVSDRLGIAFEPQSPYKLCDLKPAFGYIHENDIKEYDFWGFSDIDLVYGKLRDYFTTDKLSRYWLISTHSRRVSGHFCLMRNNQKMRSAFMRMKDWKRRLSDQEHYALDEGAFSRIFIRHKNLPKPVFELLGKLNPWRRNSEFKEAYTTPNAGLAWEDGSYSFPQEWYWTDGVVSNNLMPKKSYPYFHFFEWKLLWKGKEFNLDANSRFYTNQWVINELGVKAKGGSNE